MRRRGPYKKHGCAIGGPASPPFSRPPLQLSLTRAGVQPSHASQRAAHPRPPQSARSSSSAAPPAARRRTSSSSARHTTTAHSPSHRRPRTARRRLASLGTRTPSDVSLPSDPGQQSAPSGLRPLPRSDHRNLAPSTDARGASIASAIPLLSARSRSSIRTASCCSTSHRRLAPRPRSTAARSRSASRRPFFGPPPSRHSDATTTSPNPSAPDRRLSAPPCLRRQLHFDVRGTAEERRNVSEEWQPATPVLRLLISR
jgi:hypothetical protein